MCDDDREAIQPFGDEVIDRLCVPNAERARENERLGQASGGAGKKASGCEKAPEAQRGMF
jgi:hypothetical protein